MCHPTHGVYSAVDKGLQGTRKAIVLIVLIYEDLFYYMDQGLWSYIF